MIALLRGLLRCADHFARVIARVDGVLVCQLRLDGRIRFRGVFWVGALGVYRPLGELLGVDGAGSGVGGLTYQLGGLCAVVLRGAGNRRILNSGYGKLAHSGKTCATPGKRQHAGWCTTRVTLAIEELARQLVRFPLGRLLAACAADAAPLAPRGTAVNHTAAVCANGRAMGQRHAHANLVFACFALAPRASQTPGLRGGGA